MKTIISLVHLEKDPKLELYAQNKVEKLEKFHPKIEEINVRLIAEKSHRGQENDYYCEITVAIPKHVLEIVDHERAMDKAIDKAIERMKRLLVKAKEKEISKKHRGGILKKLQFWG